MSYLVGFPRTVFEDDTTYITSHVHTISISSR
jgi:hypothetical protein